MSRVIVGTAVAALLVLTVSCTSESSPDLPDKSSGPVAVDPDEVQRHQTTAGTPISFGIDVPDGAVQVGPLIRQRRMEVANVIKTPSDRADAFDNDADRDANDTEPQTHDPVEPTPPDFTTALLRIDGTPSDVLESTLEEISDALPDSGLDPEKWADYCAVVDGYYTGCRVEVTGHTEDDEHIGVELTVDPGNEKSKVAPAGSLLRPVMTLTLELDSTDDETGDEPSDGESSDGPSTDARPDGPSADAPKTDSPGDGRTDRASEAADRHRVGPRQDHRPGKRADDDGSTDGDRAPGDEPTETSDVPPKWPTPARERRAKPGDWILTPEWKIRRTTEVILSCGTPQVAMLAVRDGADADAIARSYVRAFADEATTPKIDEVEDRNERSTTYTPRNDGSGPDVAVTAVATGRGNYIELLFDDDGVPNNNRTADDHDKHGPKDHSDAAKRTKSRTG